MGDFRETPSPTWIQIYEPYCYKYMNFTNKLKTWVVPNGNYNNYKDDFVDEKYYCDSQSRNKNIWFTIHDQFCKVIFLLTRCFNYLNKGGSYLI